MLALRVGDDDDGRTRDRRELGRLAAMIHADLDDRKLVRIA